MAAAEHDPDPILHRAFAAPWEEEQNLADDATLIAIADAVKLPGAELLAEAKREEIKDEYQQNTRTLSRSKLSVRHATCSTPRCFGDRRARSLRTRSGSHVRPLDLTPGNHASSL